MKRKFLLLIFSFVILPMVADDTMVLVKRDGKTHALLVSEIDSIRYDYSADLPDSLFVWEKTIVKKDTVIVEKDRYNVVMSADNWYVNVENPVATDYMNEVDYSNYLDYSKYSTTFINNYRQLPTAYRKDQSRGVEISWNEGGTNQRVEISRKQNFSVVDDVVDIADNATSCTMFNLVPGEKYYYRVIKGQSIIKESHFWTTGQVRMMHLNSMNNVRDLGGWQTEDGRRIRYGRLYRGAEMNNSVNVAASGYDHTISEEDKRYMHDVMKVRLDMDLRDSRDLDLFDDDSSNDMNHTELGDDVEYYNERVNHNANYFRIYGYDFNYRWGRALKRVISVLCNGDNVYFHCTWGADRTGMLAMLLEGLLGVSENDIQKDYELTSFFTERTRNTDYWIENIQYLKSMEGETFRDKIESFCLKIGLTSADIVAFRNAMLE